MITGIEGRPGAGKSYYAIKRVLQSLRCGKTVVTNMRSISVHKVAWALYRETNRPRKMILDRIKFMETWELNEWVKEGKLRNCDLYLDEVMVTWLSRDWAKMDRGTIEFFSQHRKYNVNFFYITQSVDRVDSTLRDMTQEYISMRNTRFWRFGFIGLPQFFLAIHTAEDRKTVMKREWIIPEKKLYGLYDSWHIFTRESFDDMEKKAPEKVVNIRNRRS
jgi:zona occludens toxin (predicted ATPase)